MFSKNTYSQMSAAQKKVIDDHCTNEWALKFAAPWADFEHAGIAKLKADAGHEVYALSPRATRRVEEVGRAAAEAWADGVQEGRRRSRYRS